MEMNFSYTPETEARRLLITLMYVARGFYIKNGFYVLPEILDKKFQKKTIVLPEIDYLSLTDNWKQYDHTPNRFCEYVFDPGLTNRLIQTIEKSSFIEKRNIHAGDFEKRIRKVIMPALKTASAALPYLKGKHITFNIHPTLFGSTGSFDYYDFVHSTKKDISLELYLRIDQPAEGILELLASSLTRGVIEVHKYSSWRDTEAVSDFFTHYIFGTENSMNGTIRSISESNPELLRESIEYLHSLSAPTGEIISFDAETKRLFVLHNPINHLLSPLEYAFLKVLVQNPNTCMIFDRLTDEMYQTNADAKYSLWGIRKTAQRVRGKLEGLGIPPGLIESVKGEGFMLRM